MKEEQEQEQKKSMEGIEMARVMADDPQLKVTRSDREKRRRVTPQQLNRNSRERRFGKEGRDWKNMTGVFDTISGTSREQNWCEGNWVVTVAMKTDSSVGADRIVRMVREQRIRRFLDRGRNRREGYQRDEEQG
jgi:hypothetical protein